jgi:3D (Asp-Asp-Asp) domain-containing protein
MWRRLALVLLLASFLCALGGDTPAHHLSVTVTAYCTGTVTAAGTRPRAGIVALSRDVERHFRLALHEDVYVQGLGVYTFQDRMPWYWRRRADVYMPSCADARQFGKRVTRLERNLFPL